MSREILGIHHITAIAGDAQKNLDFYAGLLGLRLVKLTVNFDDPTSYHLYYGDGVGSPGTIMTFFLWPAAAKGTRGNGQVTASAFAIPRNSVDYWRRRLEEHGVAITGPVERFGDKVISFADPDGLVIELVATSAVNADRAFRSGPVPAEHAIHGFHSAALSEEGYQRTAALLTETMGFRLVDESGNRFRYAVGSGEPGSIVDVLCSPAGPRGHVAVGTVHHIAWRTPDDNNQREWLNDLARLQYNVSPVMDRKYFHSIYFREPGHVLFEIATDAPGFAVDEPVEQLGTKLLLPPWYEPVRAELEAVLPRLRLPAAAQATSR